MSKILFINGNLHGHINPTLPIVSELVRRGEEVTYYSTIEFKDKIENAGAIFQDFGDHFYDFIKDFQPHGNHPFYTLIEYILGFDRTVYPIIMEDASRQNYDCIIHDIMFGAGTILSHNLNIPAIASCSSFLMENSPLPPYMLEPGFHPQLDYLFESISKAQIEWAVDQLSIKDIFCKKEALNLIYTSRLFHPDGHSYGEECCFVGPSISNRKETVDFSLEKVDNRKLIYISLGTLNNRFADFYKTCFKAFGDQPYQIILSIGNKLQASELGMIPPNFIVRNYVPQLEVLQASDVFISHGGLNSISEALYYGVPVIAIPISNDQPAIAKQLTRLGAGLSLSMEQITDEVLISSVKTILADPLYKVLSDEISQSLKQAGGFRKATDIIQSYKNTADNKN